MSGKRDRSSATGMAAASGGESRREWRLVVAAAAVCAIVLALSGWTAVSYFDSINELARGAAAGVVEFQASSGRVVVYYEGSGEPRLDELDVRVTGPNGTQLSLEPFPYELRYDVGKRVGHAVAIFDVRTAATFVVTSRIPDANGRIAVGADLGAVTLRMVIGLIAALFTVALAVLFAVVLVLRRSHSFAPVPSAGASSAR